MSNTSTRHSNLSRPRKVAFTLTMLLIPVMLFGLIEGVVRLFVETPVVNDPFLNIGSVPSFFDTKIIDGREYKIVSHKAAYWYRGVKFTTKKEPGTVRIFCLGGSASAGWPHPKSEIYTAYLDQALRTAFPDKKIEIINVSTHAYASYRVRLLYDMVRNFDPDAFVVYSGNNEFLEPRTYMEGRKHLALATTALNNSAAFRIAQYFYKRMAYPDSSLAGSDREHKRYDMWTKVARVTLTLREDPKQFAKVKDHYSFNILHIVEDAGLLDVPVILVTVPVNFRDWRPNVSRVGLASEKQDTWRTAYQRGQVALLQDQPEEAVQALRMAASLDPTHAETRFHLARAYELAEDYQAAIESYYRANDLDHNPFRAVSAFNLSLRSIAFEHSNAYLADAEVEFLNTSKPFAPGFDLFLDYVHPTKKGNLIIARTVFNTLKRAGLLGDDIGATANFVYQPVPLDDGSLYDVKIDYHLQSILLELYTMMHQYEKLVNKAEEYKDVPHERMKNVPKILSVFPPYLDMYRKQLLGEAVSTEEVKRVKTGVQEFYKETYKFDNIPIKIF